MTTLIVGLVCIIMGALLTFFITTLSQRNLFNKIAKDITNVHERIHHNIPIKKAIIEHESKCQAHKEISSIKSALIFLVVKQGGNIKDLGL